jgi:hypothetical protein
VDEFDALDPDSFSVAKRRRSESARCRDQANATLGAVARGRDDMLSQRVHRGARIAKAFGKGVEHRRMLKE